MVAARMPIFDYLAPELAAQLAQEDELSSGFRAAIAADLRQTLAACIAYVPDHFVRTQLADPSPGRVSGAFWQGSLLFADMSGFTALSEKLSVLGKQGAEEVSAIINRLFDALLHEVFAYQGSLLKFGGDALTVFFDAERLGDLHAAAASQAALAMQARMQEFAGVKTRLGTFRLALRVGVHSGCVFVAEVGDRSHIELVVTGDEVNRVATAQEIAAPGEVVVSDQSIELLQGATLLPRMDGFQQLVALREVALPAPQPVRILLDGPDDLATLNLLAKQVAALRPYLVRGLPRRFLDTTTELGEFRPVSVVFANFHDFSAILNWPDMTPERAALFLNAYFRRAQEIVHRYDGIVNKVDMYTHGDKLMALFGAPTAHEDDPLRAVYCALELEQALTEANAEIVARSNGIDEEEWRAMAGTGSPGAPTALLCPLDGLKQRIGINTGTVFAGRVGGTRRHEYTVMGPAVNLSARLMSAARDGTVLLSPATRQAVEHQIEVVEQAPLYLKGISGPIVPCIARSIRATSSTTRPTEIGLTLPPLVGRDDELAMLKSAATEALRGHGRVLAVVGDAGVGKSRLCSELIQALVLDTLSDDPSQSAPSFDIYTGDCQSYEQSMPYMAIRTSLCMFLECSPRHERGQTAQGTWLAEALERLQTRVRQLAPHMERFTPLLGDAMGLALPETELTRSLTAEQRHDRLQELMVALLVESARQQPLLLALEDVQWADASSLELLKRVAQAAEQVSLLLLLNYRTIPPIAEPWTDLPGTVRLALTELSTEKSVALLTALLNEKPPAAIPTLLDRTQGNPFYIEELVRTLVFSGTLARNEAGHWELTRPLDQAAIPGSIQGLIVAQLDRLEEAPYKVAQVASVIGRRFQHPILATVYEDNQTLEPGLHSLTSAEIISREALDAVAGYQFRHALLRDVAYEAILYSRRRELHMRVAQCMETVYASNLQDVLALLANHYLLAEGWQPAFYYHLAAGVQAQNRYANREALSLFDKARNIVPYLAAAGGTDSLTMQILELYERMGDIHALLGEYDQAQTAYLDALALLNEWRKEHRLWRVESNKPMALPSPFATINMRLHRLMASVEERRSNYTLAFDWLERGLAWSTGETGEELARCYLRGVGIYYLQGEFNQAIEWARKGLSVAEQLGDIANQAQAWKLVGNLRAEQGEFGESIEALERAHALWDQVRDLNGLNKILSDLGAVYDQFGRWEDAIACYEQSLQISENIGDASAIADTSNNLAVVLVRQGNLERAYELYTYSGDRYKQIGSTWGIALTSCNRGEVLLLQGQPAEALMLFEASIAAYERIGARADLPEVLRLAAEAALRMNSYQQAHSYAMRSLELAQELGMAVEAAVVQRVLGQMALEQRDFAAATRSLEQSRATLELLNERYELGRVFFWQAQLAAACGQTAQIAPPLQQALQIFTTLDARRDLALAQQLATEYGIGMDSTTMDVQTTSIS